MKKKRASECNSGGPVKKQMSDKERLCELKRQRRFIQHIDGDCQVYDKLIRELTDRINRKRNK